MATMAEEFRDEMVAKLRRGIRKSLREVYGEDVERNRCTDVVNLADGIAQHYGIKIRYCGVDTSDFVGSWTEGAWDFVNKEAVAWMYKTFPIKYILSCAFNMFAAEFRDGSGILITDTVWGDQEYENDEHIVYQHKRNKRRVLAYIV